MKTLYLDCGMGAAGDMLGAALLELHPAPDDFLRRLNASGLPGVVSRRERISRCGVMGSQLHVRVYGEEEGKPESQQHTHRNLPGVEEILNSVPASAAVREKALAVYQRIAEAESAVHGTSVEKIHFHELGQMDAIVDVLTVCMLLEDLAPDRIIVSPISVGSGYVRCAHGLLPVPAPATALLLSGLPIQTGPEEGELCTPTGAALLRCFADEFGPMPPMRVERIGYGMGYKNLSHLNALRAFLGESDEKPSLLWLLQCNLDDMTGEELGFAQEELMKAGARDVWTSAIGMKKGRPGVLFSVLCKEEKREDLLRLLFLHTTTLGVRCFPCERYELERAFSTKETPFGNIRVKQAFGYGVSREKAEYEDLARLAREKGLPLRDIKKKL